MYCRFVRDLSVWIISPELCILHAYVNPSMKSPENPHDVWVAVRVDGTIVTITVNACQGK